MEAQSRSMMCESGSLVDRVGFELVGSDLGRDIESALLAALAGGAVYPKGTDPLVIFRQALSASIRDIESHPRGQLFQEFLLKGPYENTGEIPAELVGQRLSDTETACAIAFVYSHMVNCFKGAVTELLASNACLGLLTKLQRDGALPVETTLYVDDTVRVHRTKGRGLIKGADQYILIEEGKPNEVSDVTVVGVTEVKSYTPSRSRLREQLDQHVRRAKRGLDVNGVDYPNDRVKVGYGKDRRVVRVGVMPSSWKLPRSFRFEKSDGARVLHVDPGKPPRLKDEIEQTGDNEWRIRLRWSNEALAQAAYEMTFWYMEEIGKVIYSSAVPKGWEEMSPGEAGRNAAKMMLYYAILRCNTAREEQRAIALYNSYGYGYALGMNYRNAEGRREMLWPQDLDEILAAGKTEGGCSLR